MLSLSPRVLLSLLPLSVFSFSRSLSHSPSPTPFFAPSPFLFLSPSLPMRLPPSLPLPFPSFSFLSLSLYEASFLPPSLPPSPPPLPFSPPTPAPPSRRCENGHSLYPIAHRAGAAAPSAASEAVGGGRAESGPGPASPACAAWRMGGDHGHCAIFFRNDSVQNKLQDSVQKNCKHFYSVSSSVSPTRLR